MAFTKYASFEVSQVLDVKGAPTKVRQAALDKIGEYHDYRTEDGYLYARIVAISSRVNKNNDGWPSVELAGGQEVWDKIASKVAKTGSITLAANPKDEYGYSTFVGKPIFVDHHNSDPKRGRGVIVDSKLHVQNAKTAAEHLDPYYSSTKVDSEHLPPTHVELLLEVDAKSFPKLAKAIVEGAKDPKKGIDGFSMGCDVERSKCSHCGKVATSPMEYCSHIRMKGAHHDFVITSDDGSTRKESRKSYENCYGIKFFEISAVFDPADETALLQELVHEGSVKTGDEIPFSDMDTHRDPLVQHFQPPIEEIMALADEIEREHGVEPAIAMSLAERELLSRNAEDFGTPGVGDIGPNHVKVKDTMALPEGFHGKWPPAGKPLDFRPQGSYLSHRVGTVKTADNPLPQFMHTKSPDEVDTLREEKICPVCGETMEGEKCSVCGHIEPPDGFNNPDLQKARGMEPDMPGVSPNEAPNSAQPDLLEGAPDPGDATAVSYLQSRKKSIPTNVTSSREVEAGKIKTIERPIKPSPTPATDEPRETVISDQDRPVTATFRTAMDMIKAAKSNQGNRMSTENKIAADAPSGVGAQKRVDVEGVGGVIDATNEQASKPEGPHSYEEAGKTVDVEGKGGVIEDSNADASKPSQGTESLPTAGRDSDDSGYNKDKTTDDSGKTRTWDNSNEPGSAVTQKAFPTAAKQGVKPNGGADVQPQRRENLEQEGSTPAPQSGTDQWTGTGGNGVTRQQDPVTKKVDPNIEQRSSTFSHVVAAIKLADAEVELGLLERDKKYDRVAELEGLTPEELAAEERVISRVRTAGLAKRVATRREAATQPGQVDGRVPSFRRQAGQVDAPASQPIDTAVGDSALFIR